LLFNNLYLFSSVPGKYFLFVFADTSSVSFVSQDTNLGKTSESFGCRIRLVCFMPHFLTTERKQAYSCYKEVSQRRCLFQLLFYLLWKEIFLRCEKQKPGNVSVLTGYYKINLINLQKITSYRKKKWLIKVNNVVHFCNAMIFHWITVVIRQMHTIVQRADQSHAFVSQIIIRFLNNYLYFPSFINYLILIGK